MVKTKKKQVSKVTLTNEGITEAARAIDKWKEDGYPKEGGGYVEDSRTYEGVLGDYRLTASSSGSLEIKDIQKDLRLINHSRSMLGEEVYKIAKERFYGYPELTMHILSDLGWKKSGSCHTYDSTLNFKRARKTDPGARLSVSMEPYDTSINIFDGMPRDEKNLVGIELRIDDLDEYLGSMEQEMKRLNISFPKEGCTDRDSRKALFFSRKTPLERIDGDLAKLTRVYTALIGEYLMVKNCYAETKDLEETFGKVESARQ